MTKPDFALHRERLLALRARLRGEITQLANTALNKNHAEPSSMPTHMADLGTDNFERELSLSLLGNEEDVLDQIETALERIEKGNYGQCEACGRKVVQARLEAMPYVALCVRCASQREQEHPH